jgi:hypothetical protein
MLITEVTNLNKGYFLLKEEIIILITPNYILANQTDIVYNYVNLLARDFF